MSHLGQVFEYIMCCNAIIMVVCAVLKQNNNEDASHGHIGAVTKKCISDEHDNLH